MTSSPPPAFEHNGQLVERSRFYAIACDPRRSVAVEACAGAGKTWMLVSRMVRALLDGCAPHEILAITFTKKAAGEMRSRLQEWLLEFSRMDDAQLRQELLHRGVQGEPTEDQLAQLRGLHHTLLVGSRAVQIRTFHSWFAALVRSAPMQTLTDMGLPTNYQLLESDAEAVALVWPRFQSRIVAEAQARQDYMDLVAAHGRFNSQKALEAALHKRVEFALADAHGVVDNSVKTFVQQFPHMANCTSPDDCLRTPINQTLLQDAARALGASTLKTCLSAASELELALTSGSAEAIAAALLTKTGTPRKFSDKLSGIDTVRAAQDCALQYLAAQTQHEAHQHHQRMARLARLLIATYAQLKRDSGWLDMSDLERAALTLLSDDVLSGWVQERLDARVRHLLIDEFQDTNPLQWQALHAWLAGYTGAGKAPSVFLVGDPKQSIYRFRRAEPQVFRAAQAFVKNGLGGDLLSCDHTRRNAHAVIGLVNAVMEQAQGQGELDGFRAHSTESKEQGAIYRLERIERAQAATKKEAIEGDEWLGAWRNSLTTPREIAEETRKTLECRQAARWLAEQFAVGAFQPKDVMVLARKRERLGLMQAELSALHIAALQPEKTDLADMPEVQDVVALLDVLVSPAHDLSLARALKSPIFGVSDADLVQLVVCQRAMAALSQNRPSWWQVLQQAVDLPATLAPLGACLLRWKGLVDSLPPHDALSAIYHDGNFLERFAAAAPPVQRQAVLTNLRALLGAALQVDGGRYTTAYALVRALRAGGLPAPVRADAQAVRLLTVHGAKGLEAPLVLVLDTDAEAKSSETMGVLVDWPGEDVYPKRFVFLASESKPPACVVDALGYEQAQRLREELNALYVALTRTQSTLVLSALEPHRSNPGSWWNRLHDLAADAPWQQPSTPETAESTPPNSKDEFTLLCLPKMPAALAAYAQQATEIVAIEEESDLDSRTGQAMHRLLERYAPTPGALPLAGAIATARAQARIAQEFALGSDDMARATAWAQAIVQGEGAWAWDAAQLAWAGNEVALVHAGQLLRMDRLVQRRTSAGDGHEWWVLDYKSASHPEQDPALCAQLHHYRAAVAQANPTDSVRAAFLTGQGTLIELRSR